jgi:predicted AlkP superfamily phosphohydrolase/phosphomutase
MDNRKKTLVIGLDGATFKVLGPLMRDGILPSLQKIMKSGTCGILKSTLPTNSFTAWASFMTGKNPGKHGIYDFRKSYKENFFEKIVVTSRQLQEETIFQTVSRQGLRAGAINVPLTYPPYEINGFMISGILAPKISKDMFYPQDLFEKITANHGKYLANVSWSFYKNRIGKLINDISSMTEQRKEIAVELMNTSDLDLLVVVFVGTDRIQHRLLNLLIPEKKPFNTSSPDNPVENIREYYSLLDRCVGELITEAGPAANIFILSDHGFHLAHKQFKVNKFLEEIGMLKFSRSRASLHNVFKKADIPSIRKIRRALFPNSGKYLKAFAASGTIDWTKTKAYSTLDMEQGISVNLMGREPYGIVKPGEEFESIRNRIKDRLLNLIDRENDRKVIKNVYFREEIFKGSHSSDAPDIVIEPSEYYYLGREKGENLADLDWASGDHDRDGIFIAYGKDIRESGEISGQEIIDIAPTVLYSLGLPTPDDMDGKVLVNAFKKEFLSANQMITEHIQKDRPSHSAQSPLGKKEQHELEKKLKGLGYLD